VCECLQLDVHTEAVSALSHLCDNFNHNGDALLSEIVAEKDRIMNLLVVQCRLIAAVTGEPIPEPPAPVTDAECVCSLYYRCQASQSHLPEPQAVAAPPAAVQDSDLVPCVLLQEFACDGVLGGCERLLPAGISLHFLHEIVSDESQCGAGWAAVCEPGNRGDVFVVPFLSLSFPAEQ
jgi:hypothetical protein